jgi:Caspase domain
MKFALLSYVALLSLTCSPRDGTVAETRSAVPVFKLMDSRPERFDRGQSAALFVGVRKFSNASLEDVPYAVDDAIDLAYAFALERKSSLVKPRRVVLALSGFPQKAESEKRLKALREAGAQVRGATYADILSLLQQQAALVEAGGVLIVSMASHGFSMDGVPYVLSSSSVFPDHDTALSTAKVADIVATSKARRSLLFIDACRERVQNDSRSLGPDPRSAGPLIKRMSKAEGQVIFYSAAAGNYSFDDREKQNGVFTNAVLEGLRCNTALDATGLVTVEKLAESVERNVLGWIQKNRNGSLRKATQISVDVKAKQMPLAVCDRPACPASVTKEAAVFTALDSETKPLWERTVPAPIVQATVVDLDGDTDTEVIVAVRDRLIAYDADGEELWSTDAGAGMPIHQFITGELFGKGEHSVIALAAADGRSRIAVIGPDGVERFADTVDGNVQQIVVDRPTARYAHRIIFTAVTKVKSLLDVQDAVTSVFVMDRRGKQLWQGAVLPASGIDLDVIDFDNDGKRDIALRMPKGRIFLSFDGVVLQSQNAQFVPFKR